jgi:biopolymer transport protein ExbD
MAGTLGGGKGRGIISGINVTPLVDVVLVLLIILMVSANYIVSRSLKVDLPKTVTSDEASATPSTVILQKDGTMLFNDEPIEEAELVKQLKVAATAAPDLTLVVSADKEVPHGKVVHLLDVTKGAGVQKFAINVQASDSP